MVILSISENILLFVSGFGIMQAILLVALLMFYPKSDRYVNGFLCLYICALTLPIVLPVSQHLFSWQVMILLEPLLTLIAPFLYFYVRSFKEVITWKKAWPHFILLIVCMAIAWWNYSMIGSKYPPSDRLPPEAAKNFLLFLPITIRIVQRLIYYFLSLRALSFYQRSIQHLFSDTSRINLNWVRWLINGSLFLIIITLVFYPLMVKVPEQFDLWVLIPSTMVSLYIYIATFKGITQPTLWQIHPHTDKEKLEGELNDAGEIGTPDTAFEKPKYQKSAIGGDKINEITSRVLRVMEQEKLYQEPELTLQDLADKLQHPAYQVSQALNEGLKKSFYDLINTYRVEEAKRLLLDPKNKNYTILSVGFEAGFNSKTTFNTVFKKFTGVTPTEFRNKDKEITVLA